MTITRAEVILFRPTLDRELADHLAKLSAPRRKSKDNRPMFLGTVSRWDRHRRFGFIAADSALDGIDPDKEIYTHRSRLPAGVGHLEQGARVEFLLEEPHVKGRPMQARVLRVLEVLEAA
jgi:cold shock CspA family protein